MSLFKHTKHPHQPRNVNLLFEAEQAAAGFNQRVATGMTQLFSAMQQKISDHADYYAIVEQAIKTPLLVIDDIDKAKWTEWREEQYFAIIDERVKHERPTAISTNRLEELDKFVGGAVCSRLQIGQIAVPMNGADYRREL